MSKSIDDIKKAQPFPSIITTLRDLQESGDGTNYHFFSTVELGSDGIAVYFNGQQPIDGMYPSVHIHVLDNKAYATIFTTEGETHTVLIGTLDYNSELAAAK